MVAASGVERHVFCLIQSSRVPDEAAEPVGRQAGVFHDLVLFDVRAAVHGLLADEGGRRLLLGPDRESHRDSRVRQR